MLPGGPYLVLRWFLWFVSPGGYFRRAGGIVLCVSVLNWRQVAEEAVVEEAVAEEAVAEEAVAGEAVAGEAVVEGTIRSPPRGDPYCSYYSFFYYSFSCYSFFYYSFESLSSPPHSGVGMCFFLLTELGF